MNPEDVTLPLAFVAGLLSFVSPCVLPLVPAYIGYLSGTAVLTAQDALLRSAGQAGSGRKNLRPFVHALVFVMGFATVFVLLGASATFLGRMLFDYKILLARVGGVVLLVFGMRLMGLGWSRRRWLVAAVVAALLTFVFASGLLTQSPFEFGAEAWAGLEEGLMMGLIVLAGADLSLTKQIILGAAASVLNLLSSSSPLVPKLIESLLIGLVTVLFSQAELFYAEKRLEFRRDGKAGLARSFLFGVVFAAGWTPCLGPILAAILLLASQLETVGQGILLLTAYSLGLGIPFLLVGLAFGPLTGVLRRVNRYLGLVSIVSGALLAIMGLLIFSESLSFLARYGNFFEF